MSNNTRMMADVIAQGIHDVDPGVAVKVFNVSKHDKNEILANVFRSKGILVGSSTMNNVMMPKIAGMLEEITGLRFKGKKAAAFGSYGWNGGAVDRIHARLTDAGFETAISLKTKWRPDGKAMRECREHGQNIAKLWSNKALASTPSHFELSPQPQVEHSLAQDSSNSEAAHPAGCQCMVCTVCNWVYDPAQGEPNQGIEPGTVWSDVPDYFLCPECHLGKDVFVEYQA